MFAILEAGLVAKYVFCSNSLFMKQRCAVAQQMTCGLLKRQDQDASVLQVGHRFPENYIIGTK